MKLKIYYILLLVFINANYSRAGDTLVLELYLSIDTTLSDLGSDVVIDLAEVHSYHPINRRKSELRTDFSCNQLEDSLAIILKEYGVDSIKTLGYYTVDGIGDYNVSRRRTKSLNFYLPRGHSPIKLYDSLKQLLPALSLVKFHSALIANKKDETKVINALKATIKDSIYKQHDYYAKRSIDTLLNIVIININFTEKSRSMAALGMGGELKIDLNARRYNLFVVYGVMYVLN